MVAQNSIGAPPASATCRVRPWCGTSVMTRLGDTAQIEGIPVFVADDEAEEIDVEVSAHRQVLHGQHRMARAGDVEGRIVDGLRNAHGALQSKMSNRRQF